MIEEKLVKLFQDMVEDVNIIDFSEPVSYLYYIAEMLTSEWFWYGFGVYCIYRIVKEAIAK
jgi:hypothetical protein